MEEGLIQSTYSHVCEHVFPSSLAWLMHRSWGQCVDHQNYVNSKLLNIYTCSTRNIWCTSKEQTKCIHCVIPSWVAARVKDNPNGQLQFTLPIHWCVWMSTDVEMVPWKLPCGTLDWWTVSEFPPLARCQHLIQQSSYSSLQFGIH